jgi:hypothetical protein
MDEKQYFTPKDLFLCTYISAVNFLTFAKIEILWKRYSLRGRKYLSISNSTCFVQIHLQQMSFSCSSCKEMSSFKFFLISGMSFSSRVEACIPPPLGGVARFFSECHLNCEVWTLKKEYAYSWTELSTDLDTDFENCI